MSNKTKRPVVVTTQHRGVFFGYTEGSAESETIRLEKARMCVYWSPDTHGILGLATRGPLQGARVTPAVQSIVLRNITAVIDVTSSAVEHWESEPWS